MVRSMSTSSPLQGFGGQLFGTTVSYGSVWMSVLSLRASVSYDFLQDVTEVVDTCHQAGISKKTFKLRPIGVIKG